MALLQTGFLYVAVSTYYPCYLALVTVYVDITGHLDLGSFY